MPGTIFTVFTVELFTVWVRLLLPGTSRFENIEKSQPYRPSNSWLAVRHRHRAETKYLVQQLRAPVLTHMI